VAQLTFYTNPMSRGQIARWMLEEVGQPYEQVILGYGGTMKSPDYLAINPMGKVPAIKHGDTVVTEAAAICAYLADAFPEAGLAPPAGKRGAYYRWLFFAAGPVEAAVTANSMGTLAPADKAAMVGYGSFEATLDALESAMPKGDGWIAGPNFSAADVYVGSQVDWGLMFKSIPARPSFEAYAARLHERPAYQRSKAIDTKLMEEMQAAG
jgi:glutathione S-transferase